jgi:hypothetical protein
MIRQQASLTELQREVLHTLLNQGPLKRTRGGFAATPGAKPFTVRTVQMLERAGDVVVSADRSSVAITAQGSALMLQGQVELVEQAAA